MVRKLGFCVQGGGSPGRASKLGRPGGATRLQCDLGPVPAWLEPVSSRYYCRQKGQSRGDGGV